jgi:ribonuclease-3
MTPLIEVLTEKLNYSFRDPALLQKALTHRSFAVENNHLVGVDNERLEFLGDAVLDLVVSDLLWRSYPTEQEGPLSHRRAALVSEGSLAIVGQELGLSDLLILGKGERQSGGALKPRLVASAFEALIGAIYLDSNYETVFRVVAQFFHHRVQQQGGEAEYRKDYKTRLQEVIQKELLVTPTYVIEGESGPPHDRRFRVSVRIGERAVAFGEGKSKKQAEQNAAEVALKGKTYETI